jgi:hypothetical protein
MAEVVHGAQQEFWRSPTVPQPAVVAPLPAAALEISKACAACGTEFMVGARFCHSCGLRRPTIVPSIAITGSDSAVMTRVRAHSVAWVTAGTRWTVDSWRRISFPDWLHYLHFHEIKRWVGLPTAALIAFFIGLGCVAGAIGVSLFYKASNLAEFQAIQTWRIEWLLAATASFVAGILLKKPSND